MNKSLNVIFVGAAVVIIVGGLYGIWKGGFFSTSSFVQEKKNNQLNIPQKDKKSQETSISNDKQSTDSTPKTVSTHWNYDPNVATIFVSIVSHNEDVISPNYPDFVQDRDELQQQRDAVASFSAMLEQSGMKYNFQTDWNFLLGLKEHESENAATGGKNLLEYISSLGFSVDPHSHEHDGYTYADVAYLISTFAVDSSGIVGGFLAYPPSESKLEKLWKPISGGRYNYAWTPEILWGAGTSLHQDEASLWISGIWNPKDAKNFTTHSVTAPLPHVGSYYNTWDGLDRLLELQKSGELKPGMYTQTIFVDQRKIDDEYIDTFRKRLAEYDDETRAGHIVWVSIQEAVEIWKGVYQETTVTLVYDGENTGFTTKSSCEDDVCEEIEFKKSLCLLNCN